MYASIFRPTKVIFDSQINREAPISVKSFPGNHLKRIAWRGYTRLPDSGNGTHLVRHAPRLISLMRNLLFLTCFILCHLLSDLTLVQAQAPAPAALELEASDGGRYGFSFSGTFTNREKADFVFTSIGVDLSLCLRAYDIDNDTEVSVLLNGAFWDYLPTTSNNGFRTVRIELPAEDMVPGENTLSFVQRVPGYRWGITDLGLTASKVLRLDVLDGEAYGFSYRRTFANREKADFVFKSTGDDLVLSLSAFDIDGATEVSVLLNGDFWNYLPTTANNGTGKVTIKFPVEDLVSGNNTLSFVQRVPGYRWGISDLLLTAPKPLSLDVLDDKAYGFSFLGTSTNPKKANFIFTATGNDLSLGLCTFDIDNGTEVSVLLNGAFWDYLPVTANNDTGFASITFPADSLLPEENVLSFAQRVPGYRWGISDLLLSETNTPGIFVKDNQIVSLLAGPMTLKGVNFEGSWLYSQGQKLDEVAKTGANSVRIVWNTWQNTQNLSLVMNSAISNGLLPILELHDATIGHQLSNQIGDVAAFRQVVDWWVSEDVKSVLLPLQDQMIVNIANEAFRTDFGQPGFVQEYTNAITKLRGAGYTTHFIIDGPQWGQDYVGGVARLRELQQVDSNISLGVHMYNSFLPDNAIDDLFNYMSAANVPWIIGEFSVQTPGCSGELDYQKVMRLANESQIGYQAWSWGHGNSDCAEMDMTLPNGDFADLTDWGRIVADDLANSPNYLIPFINSQ